MPGKIRQLMEDLAANPQLFRRFSDDPDAVMDQRQFTARQKAIVLDGTIGEIRGAVTPGPGETVYVIKIKMK